MIRTLKKLLFENGTAEQTVAKNTAWLTVSQFGARLVRAAFMVFLARLVGAEGYGILSYALSLAALVSAFTDLGISGVITREGSRHHGDQMRYLATGVAAKTGLVIVAGIVLGVWGLLGAPNAYLIPLVILVVAFDGVRDLATALFRAQEKMELEAYVQLTTNIAIAAIALTTALVFGSPAWILAGYGAGCALGAAAALWPLRKSLGTLKSRYDNTLVRNLVKSSWTFGVVGLVGSIMLNTDAIMLALFRPAAEVGFYAAAQRIVQLAYILPLPIASALFPTISRIVDDKLRFKNVVEGSSRFLLIIGTGGAIALLAASGATIRLLYGEDYAPAAESLAVMSLTLIPSFVVASLGNALFALRKEKALIGYAVIAAGANILGNLLLIPRFGAPGSAAATLIAQIALLGYLAYVLKRAAGIVLIRNIAEIAVGVIAGIATAVILMIIGINGIIAGAVSLVAYIATLYALKDATVVELIHHARKLLAHAR